MKKSIITEKNETGSDRKYEAPIARRKFLMYSGLSASALALATAVSSCNHDNNIVQPSGGDTVDLGSGDYGILNYAYALEQLEAAFYIQVIASPYGGMSDLETNYFTMIRDHEVAHRQFLKAALAAKAIPGLEVDFSSIDFTSKDSVLATAKAFEDLGVSAYNGAGSLIESGDYLLIAGKIVSVEARHAAFIRDLISYNSFVDSTVVDSNSGLEISKMPSEVLPVAQTYVKTKITAKNLPTN